MIDPEVAALGRAVREVTLGLRQARGQRATVPTLHAIEAHATWALRFAGQREGYDWSDLGFALAGGPSDFTLYPIASSDRGAALLWAFSDVADALSG